MVKGTRWATLGGLIALSLVGELVPRPAVRDTIISVVGLLASALVLDRGIRLPTRDRRPVIVMGLSGLLFVVGSVVRVALHAERGPAFPSLGEPILLLSYLGIFASTTILARLRRAGPDQDGLTDALVIGAAFAIVTWSLWLARYVGDSEVIGSARVTNVAFSICSTLIVVACIRLAVGPGAKSPSFYYLICGVGLFVASDLAATISSTGQSATWVDNLPRLFAPWIYVLFGAAVLHPTLHRLAEPPAEEALDLTRRRQGLLVAALLTPPVLLGMRHLGGVKVNVGVVILGWLIIVYLVFVRFTRLVDGQRRVASNQQILRDANAALAAASSRHAMYRATLRAIRGLAREAPELRASIVEIQGSELRVLDSLGYRADEALGSEIDLSSLSAEIVDPMKSLRSGSFELTHPIDLAREGNRESVAVLALSLHTSSGLAGSVVVTAPSPLLRPMSRNVETLASTVSLALEAAVLSENLMRRRSERRFRALVENSSDVVLVLDENLAITFASPASQRLLGLSDKVLSGTHPARWIHPEDWHGLAKVLTATKHGDARIGGPSDTSTGVEVRMGHVDGSFRWFEVRTSNLSHDPEIRGIVLTAREVSDRKATEQRLAASEARFRALVHSSSDIVAVIGEDGCFTYVSPATTEMLGYQPHELEGTSALRLMERDSIEAFLEEYPELAFPMAPNERLVHNRVEVQLIHRSGEPRIVDVTINDLRTDPAIGGVVMNARDVTVRKALEADLRFQALHDALTGLPNRTMFTQQTAVAIREAAPVEPVAALFIDLDDFKTVNDSLGHAVGDELLQEVSRRLVRALPDEDLAARLGGDEFAVLVVDASEEAGVVAMAEEVLAVIAQPYRLHGREIQVSASIGIAFATDDLEADAEVLLRSADVAMYLAKDRGKNRFAIFEAHMHASVFERLELKADLVRAIDDGQLRVHYQPIVSLRTGRITGVEALVRWEHPIRGWLTPDSFIPLAEDTGLVIPLGRWVLREACQQLRTWQLNLPSNETITMSVNLSVRQLADDDLVRDVQEAIEDAALDPSTLTLEITETTLMHDTELARLRLIELRRLGLSLAVDDFGTGYSSLQYVQRFPIDAIKIDRSFVTGLGTTLSDGAVVQSMIELSQRLGVHTVAEGIERPEQVRILQSLGADLGQGYLFAKPMAADQIDELLIGHPNGQPHFLLA